MENFLKLGCNSGHWCSTGGLRWCPTCSSFLHPPRTCAWPLSLLPPPSCHIVLPRHPSPSLAASLAASLTTSLTGIYRYRLVYWSRLVCQPEDLMSVHAEQTFHSQFYSKPVRIKTLDFSKAFLPRALDKGSRQKYAYERSGDGGTPGGGRGGRSGGASGALRLRDPGITIWSFLFRFFIDAALPEVVGKHGSAIGA